MYIIQMRRRITGDSQFASCRSNAPKRYLFKSQSAGSYRAGGLQVRFGRLFVGAVTFTTRVSLFPRRELEGDGGLAVCLCITSLGSAMSVWGGVMSTSLNGTDASTDGITGSTGCRIGFCVSSIICFEDSGIGLA